MYILTVPFKFFHNFRQFKCKGGACYLFNVYMLLEFRYAEFMYDFYYFNGTERENMFL